MPHRFETLKYRLVDFFGPGIYAANMGDTDVKVKTSDSEVLLILEAASHEALKNIVAVDSECVVPIVDRTGLHVNLTAGAK